MDRPTFEAVYMQFALSVAKRSTCSRLNVGCVITTPDYRKVLSIGYNGNATGLPNCCDSTEPGKCGCLHAEENAVINCDSPRYVEKIVFSTHSPCVMCAKRIINLGHVVKVIFGEVYRIKTSIQILSDSGIEVHQMKDGVLCGPLMGVEKKKR